MTKTFIIRNMSDSVVHLMTFLFWLPPTFANTLAFVFLLKTYLSLVWDASAPCSGSWQSISFCWESSQTPQGCQYTKRVARGSFTLTNGRSIKSDHRGTWFFLGSEKLKHYGFFPGLRSGCCRKGGCPFLGVFLPYKHYISSCFCMQEYTKDDKYLLQELQLFTTVFVEESNTAFLFLLWNWDFKVVASSGE